MSGWIPWIFDTTETEVAPPTPAVTGIMTDVATISRPTLSTSTTGAEGPASFGNVGRTAITVQRRSGNMQPRPGGEFVGMYLVAYLPPSVDVKSGDRVLVDGDLTPYRVDTVSAIHGHHLEAVLDLDRR